MRIDKFLQPGRFHEIEKYSSHPDFSKSCVAFSGAPRKHPYDIKKLILISDPFSTNTVFFEFNINDIVHVEELSSIVNEAGESLRIVKIWVKKGSLGLRYEPFVVEDTLRYLKDTEAILRPPSLEKGKQNEEVIR